MDEQKFKDNKRKFEKLVCQNGLDKQKTALLFSAILNDLFAPDGFIVQITFLDSPAYPEADYKIPQNH